MKANDQRVREFAYQIWESEGKPHGQASRHWEMACKLAASDNDNTQMVAGVGVKSEKAKTSTATKTKTTPAIKAPAKKVAEKVSAAAVNNIDDKTKTTEKATAKTKKAAVPAIAGSASKSDAKKITKPAKANLNENQLS